MWRALSILAACSGLALAGIPAIASATGTGPSSCAQPSAGQVGCAAVAAPGRTAVPAALQTAGTAPLGLAPADLRDAYSLPSSSGGVGQTVAVVTAYDDATTETDMGTYRTQYDIAACSTACFSKVNETGGTTYPGAGPAGWSLATAEALDMISAVCPNCHILLVEADSTAISDLGSAENEAVTLGARFVVNTWFTPEFTFGTSEPAYDSEYFDHPGVAITAPDGNGAGYPNTYYPAASPDVIAVGGTTLTQDSGVARGWTETAWDGTGSGCSPYEAKPSWQTDTGCSDRMLNDASAVADPDTPVAFYDSGSGGWVATGGNGVAAAIVAAAYALAGTPAGDVNPAAYLYANATGLDDITGGSNGTCSPAYFCTAGTGYDGPTGLGTPDGVSAFLSSYYQPMTPKRFLDTRNGTGGTTGPLPAYGTVKLKIAGVNGIPPANVTAVAINLTATGGSQYGYISAYPDGTAQPGTSNLNYVAGASVANLAIVPVGADGDIDLHNGTAGTTQLIGDVSGYFTSDPNAAGDTTYVPVTPARVLDTRSGLGAPKAKVTSGGTVALQVGGANGIPAGAAAVAINLLAVDETGSGFLTAYADGSGTPGTSGLQFGTAPIAGLAIVPVGADGKIDIQASANGESTDVVGDISGYFTPGTGGEKYRAIAATRLISSDSVASAGTLAVTPGATVVAPSPALVLNVTDVQGTSGGYLVAHAAGTGLPATSNLNYATGRVIPNLVLGATGGGATDLYNASFDAAVLDVDCFGYFAVG
jgi:hypothetical protein